MSGTLTVEIRRYSDGAVVHTYSQQVTVPALNSTQFMTLSDVPAVLGTFNLTPSEVGGFLARFH
jgi:hypothetical protein